MPKRRAPLPPSEKAALVARLRAAWERLPEDQRGHLRPLLDRAHEQLGRFMSTGAPPDRNIPREVLQMKAFLTGDWDQYAQRLDFQARAAIELTVGPGGEIFGTGKYQELDPRWELVAGSVWLENLLHQFPFPAGAPAGTVAMPDKVKIALVGDFGTGNFGSGDSPSTKIAKFIPSLKPHVTIHLGDVYYAGTKREETDNLIEVWPQGSLASFALNSNHEMYSGGSPYFREAIGGAVFGKSQAPFSFFALENANWIVVGLDAAYHAGVLTLYKNGSLGSGAQVPFLERMARMGKNVVVLTHHNGLPEDGAVPADGSAPTRLWQEVMGACGATPPAYWYWAHVHAGVVYAPQPNGVLCRCAGHAALPWGVASDLQNNANVVWFENRNANDPDDDLRVFNGFVALDLDGPALRETFYDENGRVAWTS